MSTYQGSLRIATTTDVVDAVFTVEAESLHVMTGRQELGTWPLTGISIDHRGDGLHVALDGEDVIVQVANEDAFTAAISTVEKPRKRVSHAKPKDRSSLVDRAHRLRGLFSSENWRNWLRDTSVRWSIASLGVVTFALLALFATNTLGMILVLLGMVGLIVAALAVSDDLSAYRVIPEALSETALVIGGAIAMGIGALLIVIG